MHTKIHTWFFLFLLGLFLTACTPANASLPSEQAATETILPGPTNTASASSDSKTQEIPDATRTPESGMPAASEQITTQPQPESTPAKMDNQPDENAMTTITIFVNGSSFSAKLYDNEATRALLAQFPLDLNMSELNGREKYYKLPENLPSSVTEKPETIHAGEIMLWSSNVLVLFYDTFSNSYGGYVKLGYVEDVAGLADVLGGNAQVTFAVSN